MPLGHGILKDKAKYVKWGLTAIGLIGAYLIGDIGLGDIFSGLVTVAR